MNHDYSHQFMCMSIKKSIIHLLPVFIFFMVQLLFLRHHHPSLMVLASQWIRRFNKTNAFRCTKQYFVGNCARRHHDITVIHLLSIYGAICCQFTLLRCVHVCVFTFLIFPFCAFHFVSFISMSFCSRMKPIYMYNSIWICEIENGTNKLNKIIKLSKKKKWWTWAIFNHVKNIYCHNKTVYNNHKQIEFNDQ